MQLFIGIPTNADAPPKAAPAAASAVDPKANTPCTEPDPPEITLPVITAALDEIQKDPDFVSRKKKYQAWQEAFGNNCTKIAKARVYKPESEVGNVTLYFMDKTNEYSFQGICYAKQNLSLPPYNTTENGQRYYGMCQNMLCTANDSYTLVMLQSY